MVLGFSEMTDDDRPPRSIWLDDDKLEVHFEAVRERMKARARGDKDWSEIAPMEQNELTKTIKRGG